MKLSIVIPTFNEEKTIRTLIINVFDVLSKNRIDGNVITVDCSKDSTPKILKNLKKIYPKLFIAHQEERGLGKAYSLGIKEAMRLNSDLIMTMDADFSHDPKYIPNFIKKIKGCDIVLGSRYISGGGIKNWAFYRRLMSKGANLIANLILDMKLHDLTTGYRCYRRGVFNVINPNSIKSEGYSFLEEILYLAKKGGFKIKETPIIFIDRTHGKSKLKKTEMFKFFLTILRLRLTKAD